MWLKVTIESSVENVAGVKLPVFSTVDTGEGKAKEAKESIGLGKGGKVSPRSSVLSSKVCDALICICRL